MADWKPFTIRRLGGLNEDENPAAVGDHELTKCLNVARFGNMTGTRPGVVRPGSGEDYETQLPASKCIQGMYEYRKDFDEGRALIVVADHASGDRIFYQDDARLPTFAGQITAGQDNLWTFCEHQNNLFAAGGAATDDIWYWGGDTGTAPNVFALTDSAANRIRPKFITSWRNYVLINGMRSGASPVADNNPMVTRYCDVASDATDTANWPAANTIGFSATRPGLDSYGPAYSTGFAKYQDNRGDYLLLLSSNQITAVVLNTTNDFLVNDAIPNGCVSQRAFVSLGLDAGDAVYMSNKGFHSMRQSQEHGAMAETFLSWKIRPTFATLNRSRMQYTVGAYDEVTGRVVFAVCTGSNTSHDLLLVLDVKDKETLTAQNAEWYKWRLHEDIKINDMFFGRAADGTRRLYFGDCNGNIGYFSENVFSDFDSDGGAANAYSVEFQTKHQNYGSTLSTKLLGDVMVTLQPGGTYHPVLKFVFNYGETVSPQRQLSMPVPAGSLWGTGLWGTAIWGTSSDTRDCKVYGAGAGRTIAMNFTHSGGNEPFWVGGINHDVLMMGKDPGVSSA